MTDEIQGKYISSESLAAFLDGNATLGESIDIIDSMCEDAELREVISLSHAVDAEMGVASVNLDLFRTAAVAAKSGDTNYCCIECEKYVLDKREMYVDGQKLVQDALQNNWQTKGGTQLCNIGRQLELQGLSVRRKYDCTIDDIVRNLNNGCNIIAVVDGGELLGDEYKEYIEDLFVGEIPDHAVVVLSCDVENNVITIYDPDSSNCEDAYPIEKFVDAWADSKFYLVMVSGD